MRIRQDHFYILIAFNLICLLAILGTIILSNNRIARQAKKDTASLTPHATPTFSVPNPLIYLTSKQITAFFTTNPSKGTLDRYKTHIALLPVIKMPILIKGCNTKPAMDVVTAGTTLLFQNTDNVTHTITYQNHQTTISASGSAKIANTTQKNTFNTYDCDGTKYVGVIYSR